MKPAAKIPFSFGLAFSVALGVILAQVITMLLNYGITAALWLFIRLLFPAPAAVSGAGGFRRSAKFRRVIA